MMYPMYTHMYLQCFCLAALLRFSLIYFQHTISPYGLSKCWPRCVVLVLSFSTKQFMTTFWTNVNPYKKITFKLYILKVTAIRTLPIILDFGEDMHKLQVPLKFLWGSHSYIPNHPSPLPLPPSIRKIR